MIEHVLRSLAQIEHPLAHCWWFDSIGHILGVDGAGRVIVATDAADAAGDKVGVARIFALHEEAVAPKNRGGAMALRYLALFEVNLSIDAETANDACNQIPQGHFLQAVMEVLEPLPVSIWVAMITPPFFFFFFFFFFLLTPLNTPLYTDLVSWSWSPSSLVALVRTSLPLCLQDGSLLAVFCVSLRSLRISRP